MDLLGLPTGSRVLDCPCGQGRHAHLLAETGFERPAALAEVKRYTATPTYQLSYLFGRHMIEKLKADVERREGADFSLKRFHDTLIYGGTMPVSYARRLFETNGR